MLPGGAARRGQGRLRPRDAAGRALRQGLRGAPLGLVGLLALAALAGVFSLHRGLAAQSAGKRAGQAVDSMLVPDAKARALNATIKELRAEVADLRHRVSEGSRQAGDAQAAYTFPHTPPTSHPPPSSSPQPSPHGPLASPALGPAPAHASGAGDTSGTSSETLEHTAPAQRAWQPAFSVLAQKRAVGRVGAPSGDASVAGLDAKTLSRRAAVKAAMVHAWGGYKTYAWGTDELRPLSKKGDAEFGGLGATIFDAAGTLYLMGLRDDFAVAREWILGVNFNIDSHVSFFETTIRLLGGMLSAYYLSGDYLFVDKAVELADLLLPAFHRRTGVARSLVNLRTGDAHNDRWSNFRTPLADTGTCQLEFFALSRETGDMKYRDACERFVLESWQKDPTVGLRGEFVDPESGKPRSAATASLGAYSDSYYEYLLKSFLQSGRSADLAYSRELWLNSAREAQAKLVQPAEHGQYVGSLQSGRLKREMQHLACFSGGMFALGAGLSEETHEQSAFGSLASDITEACYHMYHGTPTHLSPDVVKFDAQGKILASSVDPKYRERPETVESLFYLFRRTGDPKYREWGWEIFEAIEAHCKTDTGYGDLANVYRPDSEKLDKQESFLLSETFKYLYLLFSPVDFLPLDDWVFNTEAHPLMIFHGDENA